MSATELVNNPAKLETVFKAEFAKFAGEKGYMTLEDWNKCVIHQSKTYKIEPTPAADAKAMQEKLMSIIDPNKTGKIDYEHYAKAAKAMIEKAIADGRIKK